MLRLRAYSVAMIPTATVIVAGYILPLLSVLVLSVTEVSGGVSNFSHVVAATEIHAILARTLRISISTTLIVVLLAVPVTYVAVFSGNVLRNSILVCVVSSFWLSVLIRCFALVVILRPNGVLSQMVQALGGDMSGIRLVRSEVGVLIGMVHYMLPLAVMLLYGPFSHSDRNLIHASFTLGASLYRTVFAVFLPPHIPAILSTFVMVFIFSLGFYVTPAILGGGRVVMIAEYIGFNVNEILNWGLAATLSLVLLAISLALYAGSQLLLKRPAYEF